MNEESKQQAFGANTARFRWTFSRRMLETAIGELRGLLGHKEESFVQLNQKFAEGSMPEMFSPRGAETDEALHAMFGLDPRTRFKVGMDGMGMLASGLIWLNAEDGFAHMLATKGDIYNKGRVGVIGGMASDSDEANPKRIMLREVGQEVGNFPFQEDRMIEILTTQEWRKTDSRGVFGIWSRFYVYLATGEETEALVTGYAKHVAETGGDPEIQSIRTYPRREVLELIRDGRMAYFDQTQAFIMANLIIAALGMIPQDGFGTPLTDAQRWLMAKALVIHQFEQMTDLTNGDWRPKVNPDDPAFNLALYE